MRRTKLVFQVASVRLLNDYLIYVVTDCVGNRTLGEGSVVLEYSTLLQAMGNLYTVWWASGYYIYIAIVHE